MFKPIPKTSSLYRQLSLSHLVVTLLTALILALCILIGYFWYASTGQVAAWAARDALEDAKYVTTRQDDEALDVEATQGYITELSWQYVEPERRDGSKGNIPEWYASSWYVILSPKGDVLASNDVKGISAGRRFADLAAPGFQKSWLEVKGPVRYEGKDRLLRWSLVGNLHIGFAPIITENNVLLGWIYRRFENESILQFLRGIASTVLYGLLGAAAIAIFASAFLGNRLARRLSARLTDLSKLSQAYATGDFAQRHHDTHPDEIGALGSQLNRMAEQISDQMLELRELANTNAQLLEESKALATLEERNRLARDLHDAVKQQLFGLNLNISAIRQLLKTDPDQAALQLEHASRLAGQALEEMDVVLGQLRPVSLEQKGLRRALADMLQEWSLQSKVNTQMFSDGQGHLPVALEQCLYRITQEGLHNVAKHAQAQNVTLELQQHTTSVSLRIIDDGRGFDVQRGHLEHSLGLKGMNERAVALGGSFSLESDSNGTTLWVELPLEPVMT
jgi:two-component system, NarL family, sensor histidine kinase LiaS